MNRPRIDELYSDDSGEVVQVRSFSPEVVVCDVNKVMPRAEFERRYSELGESVAPEVPA